MDEKKIKEKIKIAEQSVSELQDSDLKIKAFELVLSNLLKDDSEKISPNQQVKARVRSRKKANASIKNQIKKTELKFTETQLAQLKSFYDKLKPSGRESNVFILSNFLKQKISKEEFHEGDIEYCYQQLINLRTVAKPPAMNIENIKQTLSWLVTPSRKKQWLEVDVNGDYKISAAGILRFRELEELNESGQEEKNE